MSSAKQKRPQYLFYTLQKSCSDITVYNWDTFSFHCKTDRVWYILQSSKRIIIWKRQNRLTFRHYWLAEDTLFDFLQCQWLHNEALSKYVYGLQFLIVFHFRLEEMLRIYSTWCNFFDIEPFITYSTNWQKVNSNSHKRPIWKKFWASF